jgi:hypothetical protein
VATTAQKPIGGLAETGDHARQVVDIVSRRPCGRPFVADIEAGVQNSGRWAGGQPSTARNCHRKLQREIQREQHVFVTRQMTAGDTWALQDGAAGLPRH